MKSSDLKSLGGHFVFREVQNQDELLELLRLRYVVYRESRLKSFSPANCERIDIDSFDAQSRHFGLYHIRLGAKLLIGCVRVIDSSNSQSVKLLSQLGTKYSTVRTALRMVPDTSLAMFAYSSEGRSIADLYSMRSQDGEHIVEVGRMCLLPDYRSLRNVKRLAESVLALGFFGRYKVNLALFTCNCTHQRFYRQYGFSTLPETSERFWQLPDGRGVALVAQPSTVPVQLYQKLQTLAHEFDGTGEIRFSRSMSGKSIPGHQNLAEPISVVV